MKIKPDSRFLLLLGIVVAATTTRIFTPPLLGHPSNFSPINAIAIFSGCYFAGRWMKFAVPLIAVWVGDLFINSIYLTGIVFFYDGFYWQYGCYILMTAIGSLLAKRVTPLRVFSASISSSILFFVISNFGVWAGSGMYPQTMSGLVTCYLAAIPFFTSTVSSDLVYSALFFGSFQFAEMKFPVFSVNQISSR